jgi:2-C-methyl-D-erythritol 4-phosphate cytidylyltransferase
MSTWGIVLAGGAGVRMGAPKAFLPIAGKPMLLYSLQAFQKANNIDKIAIVARREDLEAAQNLCRSTSISKFAFVTPGGKERQDSVWEGVKLLPPDAALVAIHDSARPLVSANLIDALVEAAKEKGAVIPAVPVKDTIKIGENSKVLGTLKRSLLWSVQTPQVFRVDAFKNALQNAFKENFYGTDCASVMEFSGYPVYFLEGSLQNLKVTHPIDVAIAETLLSTSPIAS